MGMKLWILWGLLFLAMTAGFTYLLFAATDKQSLLIGSATHGHHQIEMACETCHTDPFGGPEVIQEACVSCHQAELELADDSHPRKKFTNPRNADLAERLDAKMCVTCHTEHQLEQTQEMGLTVAVDVCLHCHADVGENRASHADLKFDTCASAGCHNFHDNRALYEDFLVKHAGKNWVDLSATQRIANAARLASRKPKSPQATPAKMASHPEISEHWAASAHANANVTCASCHLDEAKIWQEKPAIEVCQSCHQDEYQGFTEGKHGMRLSANLSQSLTPMTPALGRLTFHNEALDSQLDCNSCHSPHQLNLESAAVDSCLSCHSDEHSIAYQDSPHAHLWQQEQQGLGEAGSGVSCATCHMPREVHKQVVVDGERIKSIRVQHNQNVTLRPNEKMIRPVCMQCHSLEFSIDALADESLIKSNFNGQPSKHIPSMDWALKRVNE